MKEWTTTPVWSSARACSVPPVHWRSMRSGKHRLYITSSWYWKSQTLQHSTESTQVSSLAGSSPSNPSAALTISHNSLQFSGLPSENRQESSTRDHQFPLSFTITHVNFFFLEIFNILSLHIKRVDITAMATLAAPASCLMSVAAYVKISP